ncbi:L,D-transpeptidase family protein [Natronospora cellulosivora (SeqCode)]
MKKKMVFFCLIIMVFICLLILILAIDNTPLFSLAIFNSNGNVDYVDSDLLEQVNEKNQDIWEEDEDITIDFPPSSNFDVDLIELSIESSIDQNQNIILAYTLLPSYNQIAEKYELKDDEKVILVDGLNQMLYLVDKSKYPLDIIKKYPISTSKIGYGNEIASKKTPLGIHKVIEKIGEGAPFATVFEYRINTGRIAEIVTEIRDAEKEKITSRILWLHGLEERNRNSLYRYIYIHGTNEEGFIGYPQSDGCIRMKNKDIIDLFSRVEEGTYVNISDDISSIEN